MYVCKCYSVNLKKKLLDICQKLMHNYRLSFTETKFSKNKIHYNIRSTRYCHENCREHNLTKKPKQTDIKKFQVSTGYDSCR